MNFLRPALVAVRTLVARALPLAVLALVSCTGENPLDATSETPGSTGSTGSTGTGTFGSRFAYQVKSPDGKRIIRVVDPSTNRLILHDTLESGAENVNGLAFSADGRLLALSYPLYTQEYNERTQSYRQVVYGIVNVIDLQERILLKSTSSRGAYVEVLGWDGDSVIFEYQKLSSYSHERLYAWPAYMPVPAGRPAPGRVVWTGLNYSPDSTLKAQWGRDTTAVGSSDIDDLYVTNRDGSGCRLIAEDADLCEWSRDGRWILARIDCPASYGAAYATDKMVIAILVADPSVRREIIDPISREPITHYVVAVY